MFFFLNYDFLNYELFLFMNLELKIVKVNIKL